MAQPRVRLRDFKRSISNATQITQPFMRLSPYHNLLPCIASFKGERSVLQHQFDKTLSRPNIEIHFKDDKYAKIFWKNFFEGNKTALKKGNEQLRKTNQNAGKSFKKPSTVLIKDLFFTVFML